MFFLLLCVAEIDLAGVRSRIASYSPHPIQVSLKWPDNGDLRWGSVGRVRLFIQWLVVGG